MNDVTGANPEGKFTVGLLVGMTPKAISMPMIIKPNPTSKYPFLVPHKFFSAQAIAPKDSTIKPEKKMRAPPIATKINQIISCFAMIWT